MYACMYIDKCYYIQIQNVYLYAYICVYVCKCIHFLVVILLSLCNSFNELFRHIYIHTHIHIHTCILHCIAASVSLLHNCAVTLQLLLLFELLTFKYVCMYVSIAVIVSHSIWHSKMAWITSATMTCVKCDNC